MKNNKPIENKIEEAFNSILLIKRAEPQPYLLTRINARIDKQVKSIWENAAGFISRPLVMMLGLFLIIVINISVILVSKSSRNSSVAERSSITSTDEDEYSTTFATIDNY